MEIIPTDLENIINDYKGQIETHNNHKRVMKELNKLELEYHDVGIKKLRLTKINSCESRYATFCNNCGNYGEITEAVYEQDGINTTFNYLDLKRPRKLKYYHRITSLFYDELPDKKFCYCHHTGTETYHFLL